MGHRQKVVDQVFHVMFSIDRNGHGVSVAADFDLKSGPGGTQTLMVQFRRLMHCSVMLPALWGEVKQVWIGSVFFRRNFFGQELHDLFRIERYRRDIDFVPSVI